MNQNAQLLDVKKLRIEATVYPPGEEPQKLLVVDDVSFQLNKGQVLGLIGESGAGKSTIGLAALAYGRGGCRITGGEIWLSGRNILTAGAAHTRKIRGGQVAYVAQCAAAALNPAHRILEQVIEPAVEHGLMSRAEALIFASSLFEKLGLPDPASFGNRFPHQLSGGQLQRAMTAMALCGKPALIIFDEPTTSLDVTTQIDVLAAIRCAVRDTSTAALYITHDLAVVAQIADDIMVLRNGKTIEYGCTNSIINRPQQEYTQRLVNVRSIRKPECAGQKDEALRLQNISACYGNGVTVVDDVSVHVHRGQTLAIVGESGSGKSTLARTITGLLPRRSGNTVFFGDKLPPKLKDRTTEQLRRLQMIYQMADVAMNPRQTVGEIVGRPLEFYFGITGKERRARTAALLDQIELGQCYLERYPAELSGGQKQRVCIARALAAEPDLIICDEVTSALDPLMADGILKLLMDIQQRTGVSYLFITHDIGTVRAIADSIAVMHRGKVVRFGQRADVLSPPFDDYTDLLLSSVPEMRLGWLESVLSKRERKGHTDEPQH